MAAFDARTYQTIWKVKRARAFDVGGVLMRLYYYMTNIGVVTMLSLAGYSFFVAGLVSSAIALSVFLIAPRLAKAVDRRGQSKVLPRAACLPVVGTVAMLVCVVAHAQPWVFFPLAILMGAMVSPQALVRARWTYLIRTGRLGDGAPTLHGVFSYECLLDDLGFLVAPPLSIFLASTITPIAGLALGIIAYVVGAILITTSRTTEPAVGWRPANDAEAAPGDEASSARTEAAAATAVDALAEGTPDAAAAVVATEAATTADAAVTEAPTTDASAPADNRSVFRLSPVVRILFTMMFFIGAFFGVLDVATVSFAESLGDANIASGALMVQSICSMVAGFAFGMVRLPLRLPTQLVILAVCLGTTFATTAFIDSVLLLYLLTALPAAFYAPLLIMINATCERAVPGARFTEAITWVNAGATCGLALGPTLGGVVIDALGPLASFQVGGAIALGIAVLALVFGRALHHRMD